MESVISLQNASIYQQDQVVLSEVSFTIHQGEFVYLIGRTGSCKSSILKTLYGDLWLEQGIGNVVGFSVTWRPRYSKKSLLLSQSNGLGK